MMHNFALLFKMEYFRRGPDSISIVAHHQSKQRMCSVAVDKQTADWRSYVDLQATGVCSNICYATLRIGNSGTDNSRQGANAVLICTRMLLYQRGFGIVNTEVILTNILCHVMCVCRMRDFFEVASEVLTSADSRSHELAYKSRKHEGKGGNAVLILLFLRHVYGNCEILVRACSGEFYIRHCFTLRSWSTVWNSMYDTNLGAFAFNMFAKHVQPASYRYKSLTTCK